MLSEDMEIVLRDYFRWASIDSPDNIDYPHADTLSRLRGSSIGSAGMSDDEAEHVNKGLCHMKAEMPVCYNVLRLIYRDNRSMRWLEKRGYGDRRTVSRIASDGRQFLHGVLFGAELSNNGSTTA